ncbi:TPA: molecular chaperone [Stenotrophomonas maltophilia]|uniref:fimbrial biogenesis chaperone n=1 Tax=Stenotrophomonas sp. PE591 TaxID=1812490 RepID=UPI001BAFBB58|nr:molecular chaperone [Stenotrophomonas sp. PE591]MBS3726910.1 hypothetical protein [Stenotrophomonas sp. PE591]
MRKTFRSCVGAAAVALCLVSALAMADVSVQSTRVVYPADAQEVSVQLKNGGDQPSLLQVWVSDGDRDQPPEASRAPFIIDKPLLRLEPGKSQALRIRSVPGVAPRDTGEHLYWLNVLDVPPKAKRSLDEDANEVQVALRIRLRLLYRPAGVGVPQDPDSHVQIRRTAQGLVVSNAALHYFNLGSFALVSAAGETEIGSFHVAPGEDKLLASPAGMQGPITGVRYEWIDDDGALHEVKRSL